MSQKPAVKSTSEQERHWLVRPATIRKLWIVFGVVLAITLLAQAVVHVHAYFVVDGWPSFYAFFGFSSCLLMVIFAKLLGLLLKRPDDFYDES